MIRDVPLNKVPGVLIAVGCIRAAMHHWESRRLVPYFLACPLTLRPALIIGSAKRSFKGHLKDRAWRPGNDCERGVAAGGEPAEASQRGG